MEADELAKWRHAGELARDALPSGRKLIVAEGAVLSAVTRIEDYVRRNDGGLAFPVNIATDEEAAHWTPSSRTDRRFAVGELVKLDVGVEIDGYIGDNALTVEIDGSRHDKLRAAALKGLEQVIELAAPGVTTGVLGSAVQATIEACGLRPVANLTGHGIKRYDLHSGLSIPSVGGHRGTALRKDDDASSGPRLRPWAFEGEADVSISIVSIKMEFGLTEILTDMESEVSRSASAAAVSCSSCGSRDLRACICSSIRSASSPAFLAAPISREMRLRSLRSLLPSSMRLRQRSSAAMTVSAAARSSLRRSRSANIAAGESRNCAISSIQSADRKSTRLNSSHKPISYAVFCLTKKKHTYNS